MRSTQRLLHSSIFYIWSLAGLAGAMLVILVGLPSSSIAQLDPSSALLFSNGTMNESESGAREGALDSGRYRVRPKPERRGEEPRPVAGKKSNVSQGSSAQGANTNQNSSQSTGQSAGQSSGQGGGQTVGQGAGASPAPLEPGTTQVPTVGPVSNQTGSSSGAIDGRPIQSDRRAGGDLATGEESRVDQSQRVQQAPRNDPRPRTGPNGQTIQSNQSNQSNQATQTEPGSRTEVGSRTEPPFKNESARDSGRRGNLVELNIAPGYFYNDSQSYSFYRTYSSAAPIMSTEANVWFSPQVALHGAYIGTLSGSVKDSMNGSRSVSAAQQWFLIGIRARRIFGPDSTTPTLNFGADFCEYQFRVPVDSEMRTRLYSAGAQFSLEAELPTGTGKFWLVGGSFSPKLQHKEMATGIEYRSGANVDANAVGLSVGQRIQFGRRDAIFWRLSYTVERDVFTGLSNISDPVTGTMPSGVAVTNSFTLFQAGYSWGN